MKHEKTNRKQKNKDKVHTLGSISFFQWREGLLAHFNQLHFIHYYNKGYSISKTKFGSNKNQSTMTSDIWQERRNQKL